MPTRRPTNKPAGRQPSKLDRDTSKRNVAQNKVQQRVDFARQQAAKTLQQAQKAWKKDLDAVRKLQAAIDKLEEEIKAQRTLDQRFTGQVKKFATEIVELDKQMKKFGKETGEVKMFAEVSVAARKLPQPSQVKTYADLSIFLAVMVVILRRVLMLRLDKR